ncbi:MAG: hypothetical protein ACJA2O_000120 [Candidatus Azotimanducaceae bacterium]|jgi:hypothetical protein
MRRLQAVGYLGAHTWVPATADKVQGKHQPLQWNIGSVHKYTLCLGIAVVNALPCESK